ncbi:MAG: ABC transporter ATP-binding protein [Phycisphaerae bacterium]|nr:ABC transporter ATP-binding protein [Phycisphaerae bacterium]
MKSFRRSFRYLLPYRGRLGVSLVCVLLISVLWGGGIGMMAPVLKVLIEDEGLHGWAWRSLTEDRIEAKVRTRIIPNTDVPGEGLDEKQTITLVLDVIDVDKDSRAAKAGIHDSDWIIGLYDDGKRQLVRGDRLTKQLADMPDDARMALVVYDPVKHETRRAELTLGQPGTASKLLGRAAAMTEEPKTDSDRFGLMLRILGVILAMTLLRDILRFVHESIVQTTVWRGIMNLRCDMYNAALHMPITFYSQEGTTDTMSRFLQDTSELAKGQITLFGKTLAEPGKAIASIVTALFFSWELTLMAFIAGPPAAFLIHTVSKITKRATKRALEGFATLLAVLEETLTGIKVVKAYTMESAERRRFFSAARRLFREFRKIALLDAATAPSIEALGITIGVVGAAVGGYRVLHGQMDPSMFIAWLGLMASAFDPVRKLAKVYTRFQKADAAAKRIFEVHDRECEVRVPCAPDLPRHERSVEFSNVTFRYPQTDEDTIKDVNLTVQAGQVIAIVGPNGCGKTTLVSMLPRLLVPDSGKVLIDGHDVAEHSLRSVRRQIGLVTQDSVLFDTSIAENISYGRKGATHDEILAAAKRAFVHDFVDDMPNGYDTVVGQRGATLSGGQKQRITIARAILRDPAILIFDEATSQVDADSEQRIHQALDEFMAGRTTVLIAHRFSTIVSADVIAVMDEGQIVDTGTHDELVQRCDLYKQLYQTQFMAGGS